MYWLTLPGTEGERAAHLIRTDSPAETKLSVICLRDSITPTCKLTIRMTGWSGYWLEDHDEAGNPHRFGYDDWTADVDAREPFSLSAGGTTCSLGETWFFNGWSALGGTPPDWQTRRFTIEKACPMRH